MELQNLRTFAEVVDQRSFTRASATLHLSQPAVTRQIAALEQELETRLLERRIRRVTPTATGLVLYGYARRMAALAADCVAAVRDVERGVAGRLRVAASGTAATYLLPGPLGRFRASHPAIDLTVHVCSSAQAAQAVLEQSADVGVVMDFRPHPELKVHRAGAYSLTAVMAPGHRLAARRSVTIPELRNEPMIVMQQGANLRRLVDNLFQSRGAAPPVTMEVDHVEAMKMMAAAGLGVAIVPDVAVRPSENLRVVPIRGGRGTRRHWSVLHRKGEAGAAVGFFLDALARPTR